MLRHLTAVDRFGLSLLVSAVCSMAAIHAGAADEYDLVIKNGHLVDGTGAPRYVADVAIRDGKIARIGPVDDESATRVLDATGHVVAPGFIDMMGQSATPMLRDPQSALNVLTQGITTVNTGEGVSAAPLDESAGRSAGWTTMAEYFQLLELKGLPVNVVQTVGHTQVRQVVLGDGDRRPTEEEFERMRDLVREAMEAGAIGLSTALIYPPATFAPTEEIVRLAEVAGRYGGRYFTHMRNEGDLLLEAIDEALYIGHEAKTPVHVFHLKTAGRQNWEKMALAIDKIQAARGDGQQVTADIYPYVHNGLGLAAFIHPRHFEQGRRQLLDRLADPELRAEIRREMETTDGWENWYRHVGHDWKQVIIGKTTAAKYARFSGQSLAAIAAAAGDEPWDVFFELVRSETFALPESMTEANKALAMKQPFVSFCTDVGPVGDRQISFHPRAFGSFPRLLARYVRDQGVISLEQAVAQASALAADTVFAYDRGRIAEGLAADIIVFDYEALADRSTFAQPHELSEGVRYVIVNGQLVLEEGKLTQNRPGQVLRGPGHRAETAPHAVSTGDLDERMERIDQALRAFMREHRVPGAALAVTDQGRLVLARGYGYADVAIRQPVTPESLFRIASISKPITAVAVLRLVEEGKLRLEDRVFDILSGELPQEPDAEFDERHRHITIRQLLCHRGGWDRDVSFDPMFQSIRFANALGVASPAQPAHVIRSMLGRQLDFDPGERYAYSNFGYCLLGRVIEAVTGQDYEAYVREQVLAPMGVRAARIGKTRLDQRHPGEVRYYHPDLGRSVFADDRRQQVPHPYGAWYLEAMDSHGGWIASAVDLARFASAFDDPAACPVLAAASVATMFAPPVESESGKPTENDSYYSCGWSNQRAKDSDRLTNSHSGSLPGTATLLERRADGRNVVLLFNARSSPGASHLGRAAQPLLDEAIDATRRWPDIDLFPDYLNLGE